MEPRPIDRSADDGARDRMIARELLDQARTALGNLPDIDAGPGTRATWADAAAEVATGYSLLAGLVDGVGAKGTPEPGAPNRIAAVRDALRPKVGQGLTEAGRDLVADELAVAAIRAIDDHERSPIVEPVEAAANVVDAVHAAMTDRYDAELDALTSILASVDLVGPSRAIANRLMAAGVRVTLRGDRTVVQPDDTVHDAAFDIATAVRRGARSDLITTATNRLGARLDEGWIWPPNLDPHRIAREAAANVVDAVHAAAVTYLDGLAGRAPGEADAMPPGHCVHCHHALVRRADGVWLDDVDTAPGLHLVALGDVADGLHHLPGDQVQANEPNPATTTAAVVAELRRAHRDLADLLAETAGYIAEGDEMEPGGAGLRHNWALDLIGRLTLAAGELRHPAPNPDAPRVFKDRDLADVVMAETRGPAPTGEAAPLAVIVSPGRYAREVADILSDAHNRGALAGTAGAGFLVMPRDLVEGDEQDTPAEPAPFGKVPVRRPPFAQALASAAGMLDHQGPPIPAVVVDAMVDELRRVANEVTVESGQTDGTLAGLLVDAADALAGGRSPGLSLERWDVDRLVAQLRQAADDCTMRPAPSPEPAADDRTWHVRAWHVVDGGLLGAVVVCPVCGGDDLGRQAGCDECSGTGTLHMVYRTPAGGLMDVHAHPDALAVFDGPAADDEPPPDRDDDPPPRTCRHCDQMITQDTNGDWFGGPAGYPCAGWGEGDTDSGQPAPVVGHEPYPDEPEVTAEQDVTTPAHWVDGDLTSCRFCEQAIVLTHRGWVQRWGPAIPHGATICPNAPDDAPGDGHLPLTDKPGQDADVQWSTCSRCDADIRVIATGRGDGLGPLWSTAAAVVAELTEAADEYVLCPAHPDPPGFHTVTAGPS